MDEDKILDKEISRIVQSLEKRLPPGLDERIALKASSKAPHRRPFFRKWQLALAAIPGGAPGMRAGMPTTRSLRQSRYPAPPPR